jgi:hypothetical protein
MSLLNSIETHLLLNVMNSHGYRTFSGNLNINLIGIRGNKTDTDKFIDKFCVLYQIEEQWQLETFDCTTVPGIYYRENPINEKGTAIVVPGQHRSVWTFGKHQGKYDALVQNKPIKVYRDNDSNKSIDTAANIDSGFFGINCHRANSRTKSKLVGKWSAGCQVIANPSDFDRVMSLCRLGADKWGNTFTYTLLTEQQIIDFINR